MFIYNAYPCDSGTLYLGINPETGRVKFYFHDPLNESGFYGRVFTLQMEDGTSVDVRGPWASNLETARKITGLPIVERNICYFLEGVPA